MSLINCPECNKEISDSVKVCPNCGYKITTRKSKYGKICLSLLIAIIVIVVTSYFGVEGYRVNRINSIYNMAVESMENGEFEDAIYGFESISDKRDVEDLICEVNYNYGLKYLEDGEYDLAIEKFELAKDYKDAKGKIDEINEEVRLINLKKKLYHVSKSFFSLNSRLSSDEMSIIIDSKNKYDENSMIDICSVINELGMPDSLFEEMLSTNSLMGMQRREFEDYEVSWSYHPDNGLDAFFKIKE